MRALLIVLVVLPLAAALSGCSASEERQVVAPEIQSRRTEGSVAAEATGHKDWEGAKGGK